MNESAPARRKTSFHTGTLGDIALLHLDDGNPVLSATLTRIEDGVETRTPIVAAGAALESVRDQIVEEAEVTFYGQMGDATFVVLGPDLRRRTLIANGIPVPPRTARSPDQRRAARRAFFAWRNSQARV